MSKIGLAATVAIVTAPADTSLERGVVVARTDYLGNETQYLVRYRAADGCATEAWWPRSVLVVLADPVAPVVRDCLRGWLKDSTPNPLRLHLSDSYEMLAPREQGAVRRELGVDARGYFVG